jgi:hypothetical protein
MGEGGHDVVKAGVAASSEDDKVAAPARMGEAGKRKRLARKEGDGEVINARSC